MSNPISNVVQGAGTWAPGTTTREIEGHFHKENEPQGVAPISSTGGVPNVDYSTKEKIENAITGHHGHHEQTGATGTGLTGSSTGSGLTGSSTGTGSGLTGSSTTGHNSGATSGISQKAEEQLEKRSENNNNTQSGGLANKVQNLKEHGSTADGNAGTLSDKTGTADHPAQAHSTTGAGGHHGSTDSPTGTHGSTVGKEHKEGVLDKIKHAIGK